MEDLAARIRADAEREVRNIRKESEQRAAMIEAEAHERGEELRRRLTEELRARLEAAARSERSARRIEHRRGALAEREKLLDGLRGEFEAWLDSLPSAQAAPVLAGMLARARREVPEGRIEASGLCREILGPQAGPASVEAGCAGGGFRLHSPDGRKVADLTYRSVVAEFWERCRSEVAAELFGADLAEPGDEEAAR